LFICPMKIRPLAAPWPRPFPPLPGLFKLAAGASPPSHARQAGKKMRVFAPTPKMGPGCQPESSPKLSWLVVPGWFFSVRQASRVFSFRSLGNHIRQFFEFSRSPRSRHQTAVPFKAGVEIGSHSGQPRPDCLARKAQALTTSPPSTEEERPVIAVLRAKTL